MEDSTRQCAIKKQIALEKHVKKTGIVYAELYEKHLKTNKEHHELVERIFDF